jgi:hypothetical protein
MKTIKDFKKGQKVRCIYYHEEIQKPNKLWIIDKPFTPVKNGIVVGDAGMREYYLQYDGNKKEYGGLQQFVYIKFNEYLFEKAIPISCVTDCKEAAEKLESFLENTKHRIGEKGFSEESYNSLLESAKVAKEF